MRCARRWQGVDLVVFCAAEYRLHDLGRSTPKRPTIRSRRICGGVYYGLDAIHRPPCCRGVRADWPSWQSAAGYIGLPNATLYGPTKAALINLAEVLYAELHGHGLGIYLINPGFVKSRLTTERVQDARADHTGNRGAGHHNRIRAGRFPVPFRCASRARFVFISLLPYRISLGLLQRLARTS
jgi:NADP-dependent 3-hydroxy acid dehydrogenase YdfG